MSSISDFNRPPMFNEDRSTSDESSCQPSPAPSWESSSAISDSETVGNSADSIKPQTIRNDNAHGSLFLGVIEGGTNAENADIAADAETTTTVEADQTPQPTTAQIPTPTWEPEWLRRAVLACFICAFLAATLAFPSILWYSNGHNGIVNAREGFAHVWRFGSTAALTIVATLWARVEFQALRYMPWITLQSKSAIAHDIDYALDYSSMALPTLVVHSISRKHHLVYLTALIAVLLKAEIALAPGLFKIVDVQPNHVAKIMTRDSFDTNSNYSGQDYRTKQELGDTSAYYAAEAIQNTDMPYPFGVDKKAAYQTFELHDNNSEMSRGTEEKPLRVVVDGVFSELHCLKLKNSSIASYKRISPASSKNFRYDVDFQFDGCDKVIRRSQVDWDIPDGEELGSAWKMDKDIPPQNSCSILPQDNDHFIYSAALLKELAWNPAILDLHTLAAIICTSTSWLSKVEVVDNGVSPRVQLLSDQAKQPITANMWKLVSSSVPANDSRGPLGLNLTTAPITSYSDPHLYRNDVLLNSTVSFFQLMSPLSGHYHLRRNGDREIDGWAISSLNRLTISYRIGIAMAVIFAIITLAALFLLIFYHWKDPIPIWHRNPTTPLGSIGFLHEHPDVFHQVKSKSEKNRETQWSHCSFTPIIFRDWLRITVTLLVLGVIISLVIMQGISNSSHGITDVTTGENNYKYLLWTSAPTLAVLGISIYVTSATMAYRGVFTILLLSSRVCTVEQLDWCLLDMLGIRALYHALRMRSFMLALMQTISFACAFLTTFTSVLLSTTTIDIKSQTFQLQLETMFGSQQLDEISLSNGSDIRGGLNGLLLRRADAFFTSPRGTYQDLVFPTFESIQNTDGRLIASMRATLPAARLDSHCTRVSEYDYDVAISERNSTRKDIDIVFRSMCPNGSRIDVSDTTAWFPVQLPSDANGLSYIGGWSPPLDDPFTLNHHCDLGFNDTQLNSATAVSQIYIWGAYSWTDSDLKFLSIWTCNHTWIEVTTDAYFTVVNGDWEIHPAKPPQQDLSTMKPWNPPVRVPPLEFVHHNMSPFSDWAIPIVALEEPWAIGVVEQATLVLEPYGHLPLEAFADPDKEQAILRTFGENIAFITAQLANFENRIVLQNGPEDLSYVNATVTFRSQQRLVQNALPTYLIVGILTSVVLVNLWSMGFALARYLGGLRRSPPVNLSLKGLAPEGFNSLTAKVSLLHESNAFAHMPQHTNHEAHDKPKTILSSLRFRLGWYENSKESEPRNVFTIGVLGDENFGFLGGKNEAQKLVKGKADV